MKRCARPCQRCPWRAGADLLPLDVRQTVNERIAAGEEWLCHQSHLQTAVRQRLCAGAPAPGTTEALET